MTQAFLFVLALASFQPPVRYDARATTVVLLHDLDGDGRPEIITSGNQVDELPAFSLFRNRGDGSFAPEELIASSFGEKIEDIGDLDGDGVPDLVASNYWSNGISIYRGRGSLRFDEPAFYGTATHGGPTRITDYDGDGVPDLVSLSFGSGNPVRVHLFGEGHAPKTTFTTTLSNGDFPSFRTLDGVVEMLVSNHIGQLGLIRFVNGGVSVTPLNAGPGIDRACLFADVNGDGVADVIDTNDNDASTEQLYVTLATADGRFLERREIGHPRHVQFSVKLRAGDLDGDGRVDLVVSDFRANNLYYFRGDGTGGFEEGVAIDAGGPVNDFTLGDVNGDGLPDIVTANADHTVSVLINRGAEAPPRRRAAKR